MVALVLKSASRMLRGGLLRRARGDLRDAHRKGARKPVRLQHTIEMATMAGLVKPNSNWVKIPTDMLVARAQSRLYRMVYPTCSAGSTRPMNSARFAS